MKKSNLVLATAILLSTLGTHNIMATTSPQVTTTTHIVSHENIKVSGALARYEPAHNRVVVYFTIKNNSSLPLTLMGVDACEYAKSAEFHLVTKASTPSIEGEIVIAPHSEIDFKVGKQYVVLKDIKDSAKFMQGKVLKGVKLLFKETSPVALEIEVQNF